MEVALSSNSPIMPAESIFPVERVPPELWAMIFKHLSYFDMVSLSLSSKACRAAVIDLLQYYDQRDSSSELRQNLLSAFKNLRKYYFNYVSKTGTDAPTILTAPIEEVAPQFIGFFNHFFLDARKLHLEKMSEVKPPPESFNAFVGVQASGNGEHLIVSSAEHISIFSLQPNGSYECTKKIDNLEDVSFLCSLSYDGSLLSINNHHFQRPSGQVEVTLFRFDAEKRRWSHITTFNEHNPSSYSSQAFINRSNSWLTNSSNGEKSFMSIDDSACDNAVTRVHRISSNKEISTVPNSTLIVIQDKHFFEILELGRENNWQITHSKDRHQLSGNVQAIFNSPENCVVLFTFRGSKLKLMTKDDSGRWNEASITGREDVASPIQQVEFSSSGKYLMILEGDQLSFCQRCSSTNNWQVTSSIVHKGMGRFFASKDANTLAIFDSGATLNKDISVYEKKNDNYQNDETESWQLVKTIPPFFDESLNDLWPLRPYFSNSEETIYRYPRCNEINPEEQRPNPLQIISKREDGLWETQDFEFPGKVVKVHDNFFGTKFIVQGQSFLSVLIKDPNDGRWYQSMRIATDFKGVVDVVPLPLGHGFVLVENKLVIQEDDDGQEFNNYIGLVKLFIYAPDGTCEKREQIGFDSSIKKVTLSPDGLRLAVMSSDCFTYFEINSTK